MTDLGKKVRLNRIFSHPSGRILAVAVDHLINYPDGIPAGLRDLGRTIGEVAKGRPNAITLNKGAAMRFMAPYAGSVPFIVQQMASRAGAADYAANVSVEEVLALGGDAIAVSIFVKAEIEMRHIQHLATVVREAERCGLPVVTHVYPLTSGAEQHTVTHEPEDVFYAVRMGLELGADVIKVPYTGSVESFRDIVSVTPVPVVTAGGPTCKTLDDAVAMVRDVARSGAAGATVGRNVWGFPDIPRAIERLKEAVYSVKSPA
jgi:fructose-bisphosphate aldolase, class I